MKTPETLFSRVTSYLDERGLTYDSDDEDEERVILLNKKVGIKKNWHMTISVVDDSASTLISVDSFLSGRILEINRLKVAEQITWINFDLTIGNFVLSMDRGDVVFKSYLELANGFLTQKMFSRLLNLHDYAIKKHSAQIESVGLGGEILRI